MQGASLGTHECLRFLISQEIEYPDHIKVAFAFHYDVTMIMKDLSEHEQISLMAGNWVSFCGFRICYMKGKWLEIKKRGVYMKIYDVFSFFACSFLKACEQYLTGDPTYHTIIDEVTSGKGGRSVFQWEDMESIVKPYMYKELELMVMLMTKLRALLATIDVHPVSWHGPGAVAGRLLNMHKIRNFRPKEENPYVREASQYAYYGGRFEAFKCGYYDGTVYSYDINSAYPYALTKIPALTDSYTRRFDDVFVPDFSLCRVVYCNTGMARTGINPFPYRSDRNAMYYPNAVETWVWGVEYKVAKKHFPDFIECAEVLIFDDDGTRPFDFLNDMFQQRRVFKEAGDPVQLVLKLGMNSIYGKTAQRKGWQKTGTAPMHHQLRFAGFCTAMCRSLVLDAMMQAPDKIIAVETDGVYSEVPLTLDMGNELGQWDYEEYSGMVFVQSGVYFTRANGQWSAGKTRGFAKNEKNFDIAMRTMPTLTPMELTQHKFYGLPGAIGTDRLRTWADEQRVIEWGGGGKRAHRPDFCEACATGTHWHNTAWTPVNEWPKSHKHRLPWEE